MKVIIKNDACIGCGACSSIEPEIFEINNEGIAEVKVNEIPSDKETTTVEAVESCPTGAISAE